MLDEIEEKLGLKETELADLFGIRRPSVSGWREAGIPRARRASVERLLDLARVLAREVKESRIPEIVRTRDQWLENRSILETIALHGVEPVYGYLRRLFSYQA
ncbi:MAG TPA: helix-turn-helix transcriptional regulator [Candidatus Baltobacteraceae bacterium]|nr:helix-turn-helix transcriptional regulator [Candidatus Baltobacteraceae bacterium]